CAADLSQPQCADGKTEGVPSDGAGQAQPRDDRGRTLRPARQGVLLDRRRGERLGAARSVGLPGRARRIRVDHAAPARSDGPRRAREAAVRRTRVTSAVPAPPPVTYRWISDPAIGTIRPCVIWHWPRSPV